MSETNIVQVITKEEFLSGVVGMSPKPLCAIDEGHGSRIDGVNVYPGMYYHLTQDFYHLPLDVFMSKLEEAAKLIETDTPRDILRTEYYSVSETDFELVNFDAELNEAVNILLSENSGVDELSAIMAFFISPETKTLTKSYGVVHIVGPLKD